MNKFILASRSPRRIELLKQINIVPDAVIPSDVEEIPLKNELPRAYVKRLAMEKAQFVAKGNSESLVMGADTVVACGRRIIEKAEDEYEARCYLKLLSGRRHRVISGICLVTPDKGIMTKVVESVVQFKRLTANEINAYLELGQWHDKAGAYSIQGAAAGFVSFISGSYSNVVGLPLYETRQLLMTIAD
jgi:nucleoside triphosphate pyrophosphatase